MLQLLKQLRVFRAQRDNMLVAIGVLALIGAFSMNPATINSSEAKFSDTTAQGFMIVPASCPSNPHSASECAVPPAPTGLRITCNAAGTSATINYNPTPNATSYLFRVDRQDNPWLPLFCDGRMNDTRPGDICTAPLAVSSWTFTVTPDKPYGIWMHGVNANGNGPGTGIAFSCPSPANQCPNGMDITVYPTCMCPAGKIQVGITCVDPPIVCPNGLNISLYPSCVCPAPQVQSGSICVPPPPGTGAYPPVTLSYVESYPPNSCWDGSSPDPSDGNCPPCPSGYTQVGNTCVPPDLNPHFVGFPTTKGFNASGHLEVRPSLVRSGDKTWVYWNVSNVRDCTVRGTNGDGQSGGVWNGLGSGAAGVETSAITSRTEYTLFCRSRVGGTPATITETRSVNVIPTWYEPSGQQD